MLAVDPMSFDIEDAHKVICQRTFPAAFPPEIAAVLSPFLCSCAPANNSNTSIPPQCSNDSRLPPRPIAHHSRSQSGGDMVGISVPHMEEATVALWKPGVALTPYGHMIAGAAAGVAEHCCMYPFDTLKTRLQVSLPLSPTYPPPVAYCNSSCVHPLSLVQLLTLLMQVPQHRARCAACDRQGGAAVAVQGRHCRVHRSNTQPCVVLCDV